MKRNRKDAPRHCTRCQQKLNEKTVVLLELDIRTGTYTDLDIPAEFSQGCFEFGSACAEIEKKLYIEPATA